MRWWSTRIGRAVIGFVMASVALTTAGSVGTRGLPALAFARQRVPAIDLPDQSWFPVLAPNGTQLDHTILWNSIGPSIDDARRADVIFVGNSALGFALPDHDVRAFEKRTGLSAFSLVLPAETARFTIDLIEKHDLRPRVIVANVPGFFEWRDGPFAKQARAMEPWASRTLVWEQRLAAAVWPEASRVLPSFLMSRSPSTLLRSSANGTWRPGHLPSGRIAVRTRPGTPRWDHAAALRFRSALAARGVELVLTCVPTGMEDCSAKSMEPIARALDVPAVCPRVDGALWMVDTSHMRPLSGKRFGRAFLRELGDLAVVRALERQGAQPTFRRSASGPRPSDPCTTAPATPTRDSHCRAPS